MVLLLGRLSGPWGTQAIVPAFDQCAGEGVVPGIGNGLALKKKRLGVLGEGGAAMRQLVTLNLFQGLFVQLHGKLFESDVFDKLSP